MVGRRWLGRGAGASAARRGARAARQGQGAGRLSTQQIREKHTHTKPAAAPASPSARPSAQRCGGPRPAPSAAPRAGRRRRSTCAFRARGSSVSPGSGRAGPRPHARAARAARAAARAHCITMQSSVVRLSRNESWYVTMYSWCSRCKSRTSWGRRQAPVGVLATAQDVSERAAKRERAGSCSAPGRAHLVRRLALFLAHVRELDPLHHIGASRACRAARRGWRARLAREVDGAEGALPEHLAELVRAPRCRAGGALARGRRHPTTAKPNDRQREIRVCPTFKSRWRERAVQCAR